MHLSILKTVDISICSLEMELSQVVKLSTVAKKSTQVNFRILNILLMILSRRKKKKHNSKGTNAIAHFAVFFQRQTCLSSRRHVEWVPTGHEGGVGTTAAQEPTIGPFHTCRPSEGRIVNLWLKQLPEQIPILLVKRRDCLQRQLCYSHRDTNRMYLSR